MTTLAKPAWDVLYILPPLYLVRFVLSYTFSYKLGIGL